MNPNGDLGWQAVLIMSLGGFLVICGLAALAIEIAIRFRRQRRSPFNSMQDFK